VTWISSAARVGHGREAIFGTAATINRSFGIYNLDLDLPDQEVELLKYRSYGFGRKWFKIRGGKRSRQANHPVIRTSGEFFYYAFGKEEFTSGTPNTHILTPTDGATLPSFSFGTYLPGENNFRRTFVGCVVNTLNIQISEGRELNVSGDILTKSATAPSGTAFTAPEPQGEPYVFYDLASNVSIGGAPFAKVNNLSFVLNNTLNTRYFLQAGNPRDPAKFTTSYPDFTLNASLVPSGFSSGHDDSVYHLLLNDDQRFDVEFEVSRGGTDLLKFEFLDCMARSAPHGLKASGEEVETSLRIDPSLIRCTVQDSIASYSTL
jgi:hypothetical protein